jgi:DNA-binding MurR/RpiR family transcriptional regulator
MTSNLRYFATVARHGSIREAAEELNVAQSSLSRQVQNLTGGVPLFQRHARRAHVGGRSSASRAPDCATPKGSARNSMR